MSEMIALINIVNANRRPAQPLVLRDLVPTCTTDGRADCVIDDQKIEEQHPPRKRKATADISINCQGWRMVHEITIDLH